MYTCITRPQVTDPPDFMYLIDDMCIYQVSYLRTNDICIHISLHLR